MNQTTIELTALLRQLSTVSPNECRMNDCGEWQILDTETGHWLHLYDANEIDPFRVAGLVQRRIEARGWLWVVQRSIGNGYVAVVGAEISEYDMGCKASTPAKSLLTAYIAALEALKALKA